MDSINGSVSCYNTKLFFKKQILICQEAEGFRRILILTFSSFFSLLQFHFGNFFIFLYLRLYVIAQYVKTILEVGRVCWHSGMGDLQRQHWEHQDQQVQKQKTLYICIVTWARMVWSKSRSNFENKGKTENCDVTAASFWNFAKFGRY